MGALWSRALQTSSAVALAQEVTGAFDNGRPLIAREKATTPEPFRPLQIPGRYFSAFPEQVIIGPIH
jgi:hypothetical protein